MASAGPQGHVILDADEVVGRLVDRARRLHDRGVPPPHKVRTGIRELDANLQSWWGCITLTGPSRIGKTALALRFAAETAAAGGAVLWLCTAGYCELAALRILTSRGRIRLRKVMVERSMTNHDWKVLKRVAADVSRWPLRFGDAHSTDIEELRLLCAAAATQSSAPSSRLELIVLDNMEEPDRPTLRALGVLAEELDTPILAVFSEPTNATRRSVGREHPVRGGTLAFRMCSAEASPRGSARDEPRRLLLEVCRVAGDELFRIPLQLFPQYRAVEPLSGRGSRPGRRRRSS